MRAGASSKRCSSTHAIAGSEKGLAPEWLLIIRKLYAVEKLARLLSGQPKRHEAARDKNMTPEQRHTLRAEKAKPIWDELRVWLDKNLGVMPEACFQHDATAVADRQGDQLSRRRLAAPRSLS